MKNVVLFLAGGIAVAAGSLPAQTTTPDFAPFTAKLTALSYKPDGSLGLKWTFLFARRKDGTSAHVYQDAPERSLVSRTIENPRALTRIQVHEPTASISTYRTRPGALEIVRLTWTVCAGGQYTERGRMLDVNIVHVYKRYPTATRPNGETFRFDQDDWQSPELACYALKKTDTFYTNGVAGARTVTEATELTLGDPDPALFDIPGSYTERKPSEVYAEYLRLNPSATPFRKDEMLRRDDKRYTDNRP